MLPDRTRVGTVDRFQGQPRRRLLEGRLVESPVDVPFPLEPNRLNVSLSRAGLMAIVVRKREAAFPPSTDWGQAVAAFPRSTGVKGSNQVQAQR